MKFIIAVSLLLTFTILKIRETEAELKGPNVCDKLEDNSTNRNQIENKSDVDWVFPDVDWVFPDESDFNYKTLLSGQNESKPITKECCAGYTKNKKGDQCIPFCNECKYGECVAPEKCRCDVGFKGPACDSCSQGYWGHSCTERCDCLNEGTCDPKTGACNCAKGFVGQKCENKCPPSRFGLNCSEKCSCENGGICHHVYGECKCVAGFIGIMCEVPCPNTATYGPHCSLKCMCEYGAECSDLTQECQCVPGWTGPSCNVSCPDGYYGQGCSQKCHCKNHAKCRENDGYCECAPGFSGTNCDVCSEGYYGQGCLRIQKSNPQEGIWKDTLPYLAGVILCVISIIFIGVIVCVFICHHRRNRDPKPTTIADVRHKQQKTSGKNDLAIDSIEKGTSRITSTGRASHNIYTPLNNRMPYNRSLPTPMERSNLVYMMDTSQKDVYMEMSNPTNVAQKEDYIDMKSPNSKLVGKGYEETAFEEPLYEEIIYANAKRSKKTDITNEYDRLDHLGASSSVFKGDYDQIDGTHNKVQSKMKGTYL